MDITQEITNVIGTLVDELDISIKGEELLSLDEVSFCNTKYAREGKRLVDASENEFMIESIDYNSRIKATNPLEDFLPHEVYFLPKPFFISGTKIAANNEWTQKEKDDLTKKTPLIWLLEVIRETKYGRSDTRLFSADLRIFFLDETNIRDFYTEDHRREVVYPMMRLSEQFMEVIRQDRRFQRIEEYQVISFSRFGVEQDAGIFQNILDANLSGVELQINLTMYKENCKC